ERRVEALDIIGVERLLVDEMRQGAAARRGGIPGLAWREIGHFSAPAPRRMRGSSSARRISEMNTPTTVRNAMNIRNEPARYISCERSAESSIGPVMGSDMTTETITEPEISSGNRLPISAMKGLSEMR